MEETGPALISHLQFHICVKDYLKVFIIRGVTDCRFLFSLIIGCPSILVSLPQFLQSP